MAFCIMPNHYHILSAMRGEVDIGVVMHRINSKYTKYFNRKYGFSGHLFQCPYKYKEIKGCEHLRIVSTYIEANLKDYKTKQRYPYLLKDEFLINYYIVNFESQNNPKQNL
jgi:REP element-mobilizing transposase RayT